MQWRIKLDQERKGPRKVNNKYANFELPSCKDLTIKDRSSKIAKQLTVKHDYKALI